MPDQQAAVSLTDEQVLEYLKRLGASELELTPTQIERIRFESTVTEGLQLDSLRQVILLTNIEENFGIEFSLQDRQELLAIATVRDLVRLIRRCVMSRRS